MSSTTDKPALPVSLDSLFDPPSRQQWIEMAVAGLRGERSEMDALQHLRRTTLEGIPLEVLYDSSDASLTLGITEKSTLSWDNRLCVKDDDAQNASERILQGLQGGITSVELHTHTPADIPTALNDVRLDMARVSLRPENQYETCTQALLDVATEQKLDMENWCCSLNADPITTALANGTGEAGLVDELGRMTSFTIATNTRLPSIKCIVVDVALHHNAGASTVEELHAALATATVYMEALVDAGMSPGAASKQIVFQVAMDADVLLGVAKLRALRALWQVVVEQFNAGNTTQEPATIVAETSQRFLSRHQPWNNHLRNLCAATAAMLGGADTLMVHPHDVLQRVDNSADTLLGDRMARNLAIILERECGLAKVHDPMAGSYAIEALTQQLMQHAWQSLASTDTSEGWLNELLSGRWQIRLTNTHNQRITLMQQEQRIAVGVNRFVQSDDAVNTTTTSIKKSGAYALAAVREAEAFEQSATQEASS